MFLMYKSTVFVGPWIDVRQSPLGATSKKVVVLGGGSCRGRGAGGLVTTTFSQKTTNYFFLLPFDAEAFKTCKNTIKLINLCALPCFGFLNVHDSSSL